jgi:hypothetical protein
LASKRNPTKRGKRKSKKQFNKSLRFLGVNCAGLRSKMMTFKKVLQELQPSVFFAEETKFKECGKIKVDNYIIYELVRENREGGGIALGVIKELNPAWVREGNDDVEALSVEISVKDMVIRCCAAYGCQENDPIERKENFWKYLDEEILYAEQSGAGFVLQFDGNLWAGSSLIPGDPRRQNRNGKMFAEFLDRHPQLSVVNALPQCEGLITRRRFCDDKVEESVLDFFVVCCKVLPFIKRMVIDEKKQYVLTNYKQVGKTGKAVDSDHFTEFMDLDIKIDPVKPERIEIFNYKEEVSKVKFKKLTSETKDFTQCFEDEKPLLEQIENWQTVLKSFCAQSFRKIRIRKKNIKPLTQPLGQLIDERNILVNQPDVPENKVKLDHIVNRIHEVEAEENRNKLVQNFKEFSDNPENVNVQQIWKALKRIWPKTASSLPVAKKNYKGKIISGPKDLKNLLAMEYRNRLRTRATRPDLIALKVRRKKIFKMKIKLAQKKESPDWKMSDLDLALDDLKRNKSRDPDGYVNELFKHDVIGDNLKQSLLLMMNQLKKQKLIPKLMNIANCTTVPKKGSRLLLKNERGIFRVAIVRYILMRMIYNTKYASIDKNISDCQMGARKRKGCKNNIFIVNGIIHEAMKSKKMKPVVLQIYDYAQMFDSIDLEEALNDIYNVGVDDDTLTLIHQANAEVHMAVKTPSGLTDRQIIRNTVLQGDTWGSLLASVQVDSIGQEVMAAGHFYKYKDKLPVGFLGLVDDIVGITEAGFKAQQLNAFINLKTAEKTLQFGVSKCKSMLICKDGVSDVNNDLFVDNWEISYKENPNTGETDLVENFSGLIKIEKTRNKTYLGFVISSKGDNMENIKQIKNKSIGIIRKIMNKLDSLNLQKYYFECAMILLNAILRPSILYACDVYYNLKENEIRQLERIEENFLRKVLNTSRGCPIVQLYLTTGHTPARVEVQKARLLYLQYILQQSEESTIYKFLQLQLEYPTRGDWASTCVQDLTDLNIEERFEDIKLMTKYKFSKLLKSKVNKSAFKYLIEKQGTKGKDMAYASLEMSEYLLPTNEKLTIDEKRKLFAVKNKMTDIPSNFPQGRSNPETLCYCGQREDMKHIYECDIYNEGEVLPNYEEIYNGEINEQIKIFKKFEENIEKRKLLKNIKSDLPCDLDGSAAYL